MKFKVKVLMLLVSMLFSVLGVSAQIAEGTYYLKHNDSEMYVKYDLMGELTDKANASKIEVKHLSSSYYTFRLIEENEYLCSDGYYPSFQTDSYVFEVNGTQESFSLHCSDGYLINFWDFLYFGSDAEYWSIESAGSSTPETPAYMELSENTTYYLSGNGFYLERNNSTSANFETGALADNNAYINGSKTLYGMWSIEKVNNENYVYLRNLSSNAYLGSASDALQLVKDNSKAGKYYIFEDGSIQDSETEKYIAVTGDKISGTHLSITNTKGTWTFAEVTDYTKAITLNAYGYATTCMPFNFTVSEEAEIYGTKDVHDYGDYTTLEVYSTKKAQAGQGYIIKGEPRAEVTLTLTTEEVNAVSSMLGTLIRQTGVCSALRYDYYGFKGDEFVLAASDNIPANKAVYIPASASSVMKMSLSFDEGLTTDILGLTPSASTQHPIYDLQGRSCMGQSHKGLYIQSGRKMIRR